MPDYDAVVDSGQRTTFSTGSVRDVRTGKGRFDLISVHALFRLAKHYENGAVKYGDRNWEKGQPMSCYMDSALRHLFKYIGGMRDEDHLAAAMWNVAALLDHEERIERGLLPAELNNLPKDAIFLPDDFAEAPKETEEENVAVTWEMDDRTRQDWDRYLADIIDEYGMSGFRRMIEFLADEYKSRTGEYPFPQA